MAKPINPKKVKPTKDRPPIHPWRICPYGKHYRKEGNVSGYSKKDGTVVRAYSRGWTCPENPSNKDQLYAEEIKLIAENNFGPFRNSLKPINEFKEKSMLYDEWICGWTKYWNEVLKASDPLDPKLVKALIASESGFDPSAWNKKRGLARARGLMQVTDETVGYLSYRHKELTDHFVNLKEDDMLVPNYSICAGVRWLFRKREIAKSHLGREVAWREVVVEYKSAKKNLGLMTKFNKYFGELGGA